ncbi:hypothetical protein SAMN04490206_5341 [Pseudomonas umsongensis]|nr:hypothetical protein SAMN04490206_5341 [Pseudomonas umsongensis]
MLAMYLRSTRDAWYPALSLATIASLLAPTLGCATAPIPPFPVFFT